jgi:uncharacterized protein YjdB
MKKIPVLACSSVAILALGLSIALPSGFAQNVENTTNQSVQTISENTIHSETASSGPVTLKASWDETKLGSPTTFHVEATGGSDKYMFRMDAPSYSSPDEYAFESVADPSRSDWTKYTSETTSHDYEFTMMASGTYNFHFYVMDKTAGVYYLRVNFNIQVSDPNYPSINEIVSEAVAQSEKETDGTEYAKAVWLHDWLISRMEYDSTLKWSSAESALSRGLGTCQSYESAYSKLLTKAGIENVETRDTKDAHTWNAVKIDGDWYQIDATWDDSNDNWYGFDQRHLYFGLTDELMTIAHPGHESMYQTEGYAQRSTSLKDNYYVRSGEADQWADKYAERIQKHLDALDKTFTVDVDNANDPPSIRNIVNGIITYAIGQKNWNADGRDVALTVKVNDKVFEFTAQYADIPVESVSISGDGVSNGKLSLKSGASVQLTATVKPDNATDRKVTWTSSDSSVANVMGTGVVTAGSKAGTATVTATAGGKSASVQVTVEAQDPYAQLDALAKAHASDLEDGTYTVSTALKDGMVLDVAGGSKSDRANVQLGGSNGGANQKWRVSHDSKGYVTLANVNSGKVLDVAGGSARNGANALQYSPNGGRNQKWVAVRSGSSYRLVSALSQSLVLDVAGWSTKNGANVDVWTSNGGANQQWKFANAVSKKPMTVWYRPDSSWKKTELYYRTFVGGESLSSVAMEKACGGWYKAVVPDSKGGKVRLAFTDGSKWDNGGYYATGDSAAVAGGQVIADVTPNCVATAKQ